MHKLHELKEMLCDELEKYADKKDVTAGTLEIVDKLAHAIKNLNKVIEAYEDEEYSNAMGRSYADMNYPRSYARGRNARRDSMGRYSRGYSYDHNELVGELRDLMNDAPDEATKHKMKKLISEMEMM